MTFFVAILATDIKQKKNSESSFSGAFEHTSIFFQDYPEPR
jgi:hypothetical protein